VCSYPMAGDQDKAWVRAIGKKLRDDLGDCPTLPEDMLRLLDKLKEEKSSVGRTRSPRRLREGLRRIE
jgi:hypothetical protein